METPQLKLPKTMDLDFFLSSLPSTQRIDYASMTDEELLEMVKLSPEFDKLVFPNSWYSKFNLPEKKCMDMKQFLKESPWMKTASHYYIAKQEIPAKPGGNRPVLPAPEVPTVTVIQNSFSDAPTTQTSSLCLEDSQRS